MPDLEPAWSGGSCGLTVDHVALVMAAAKSLDRYWPEVGVDGGHVFVDCQHP